MEKDDELKGIGNSYDFGNRSIYDGRVSRFISIDPRSRELPYLSPYAFAGNNPIFYLDEGGENPFPFRFKMLLRKDTSYGVGMLAGIGDGIIETLDMAATGYHLQPTDFSFQGIKAKYEAYQTTKMVFNVMSDSDLQDKIYLSLKKELGAWYTEASMNGTNAEGGYQHGKILFTILESTIGVGELQILTKTGEFSKNALQLLKKSKANILLKLKPCGCFTAGTQVYTEEGYKNIEEVQIGDKVWAYNDETGKLDVKEVIDTFTREFSQVYKIYFGDEILEATHEHPFFIGGKWLKVEELKEGDLLTLYDGTTKVISKIELVEGNFKVYNFTVEEFHTYYITNQKVLVHNGNPCSVKYGQNMLTKFKKHSAEMIAAAKKNGVSLPKGPGKASTQNAFKDYIQKVVNEGDSFVSSYMTKGDVVWSKLGDSIVIRSLDGEFITHLTTATNQGKSTLKHFDDVVSKSTKINVNK